MKIEIKVKYLIALILLLGLCIYALSALSGHRHQLEVDSANLIALHKQDSIVGYSLYIDNLERTAYANEVLIMSSDKEIKRLSSEVERLKALKIKDVSLIGELKTEIEVLKKDVIPESGDDKPMWSSFIPEKESFAIKVPATYNFSDRWADVTTFIDKEGIGTMDFKVSPLNLHLTVGTQKTGFMKTSPIVVVDTDNPYISISEQNIVLVDEQKKTPLHYVAVGTVIGVVAFFGLSLVL